jgi:pimeloyl-ACP methyl ester carboxylesterase
LLLGALHALDWHFKSQAGELRKFATHFTLTSGNATLHGYSLTQTNARLTVIFIHGTPAQAGIWHAQFAKPFPAANLVAIDRPGFGNSTPALKRPGLEHQADVLAALFTNTPPHGTILVGHSYGGPVALLAALKHPDQISGVVLIGGSVDPAQEKTVLAQRIADWPVFAWLLPRSLRQCNRELLTLRADLLKLQELIPTLRAPVVMLHGGRDRQVPVANVAWLEHELASAGKGHLFTTLVYPDYSHFIPWEHPEAVEEAISAALKK